MHTSFHAEGNIILPHVRCWGKRPYAIDASLTDPWPKYSKMQHESVHQKTLRTQNQLLNTPLNIQRDKINFGLPQ